MYMKLMKNNNKTVIQNLYKEGYKVREISQLTNHSIFTILKCLKLKKSI